MINQSNEPDLTPGAAPSTASTAGTSGFHQVANAANDYELLPYPSMPIPYTQPAYLAALATLFGIDPPAVEHARVLELGCASGGNIVPMAARFPDASFLGVDLSHRHIADGRARIAALNLQNVSLRQADLTTLNLTGAQFDYIICHGVFSWVAKATQDAILRLCNDVLAPNGIVTISYNVLPGWHLRSAIRDLCLRYGGNDADPQRRAARARAALAQIAAASAETDPYSQLMRTEATRLRNVPNAYILGEFLAPENHPCHVQDFIDKAAVHRLDFLCEADLFAAVPPSLDPDIRGRVTSYTDAGRSKAEQDIDFLTGRLFRRSVLVRHRQPADPLRVPRYYRLNSLHVSSQLRLDTVRSNEQGMVVVDDQDRPITVSDPVVAEAIRRLGDAYPATVAVADLAGCGGPQSVKRICKALFSIVLAGRATISVLPQRLPRENGYENHATPVVWTIARAEAASGQPWVTSLRHVGIPALPILRVLMPHMDGRHDCLSLRARLTDALATGVVTVSELPPDQASPPLEQIEMIANQYLHQALRYLAVHALLEPVGDRISA